MNAISQISHINKYWFYFFTFSQLGLAIIRCPGQETISNIQTYDVISWQSLFVQCVLCSVWTFIIKTKKTLNAVSQSQIVYQPRLLSRLHRLVCPKFLNTPTNQEIPFVISWSEANLLFQIKLTNLPSRLCLLDKSKLLRGSDSDKKRASWVNSPKIASVKLPLTDQE